MNNLSLKMAVFDIVGDFVSMRDVQICQKAGVIYVRMPWNTPEHVKRDLKETWVRERAGAGFPEMDLVIVEH